MQKTWINFLAKLDRFRVTPVDYWSQYDLLGYVCSKTSIELEAVPGVKHAFHPRIMKMRKVIAKLYGLEMLPLDYCSREVKDFLDWNLKRAEFMEVEITSLGYILHEGNIKQYREEKRLIEKMEKR